MSPFWGHLIGVVTVLIMLTFIGIWIWAWRKSNKPTFQRMAAIPTEDPPHGPDIDAGNASHREDMP